MLQQSTHKSLLGSTPNAQTTRAAGLIITTKEVTSLKKAQAPAAKSTSATERANETTSKPKKLPITLTDAAIAAAKVALAKRETPDAAIRLGIRGGGCSGFSYVIEFDDNPPRTRDRVYELQGVRVVVDKKSLIYLNGSVLDFEKTLMRQGFKFRNPNEASACSCGTSFTVK